MVPMRGVAPFAEVQLSSRETAKAVAAAEAAKKLRKIAPALYTSNMTDPVEAIIRRNAWQIVALYCPGAIITDRTGIEGRPAADGSVFVISERSTDVELPGLKIRPRKGAVATDLDRQFIGGLRMASPGRSLLENMLPSRARSGVARTLSKAEMETYIDKVLAQRGEAAINTMRDEARKLAPVLRLQTEMVELDRLVGSLLGSRPSVEMASAVGQARASGKPYDVKRLELFEALRAELVALPPNIRVAPDLDAAGEDNQAFFEAYFSNFIEGTEFEIDEAVDIVFHNAIPIDRSADAHDVLGTFRITSNRQEMAAVPATAEEFVALLKRRHAVIMEQRTDKTPGIFKAIVNRFGNYDFVEPNMVMGTLAQGFDIYRSLSGAFERAVFMMFLVAEVHPFLDGNGRVARLMMNAELVAAGEQRVLIPNVYRNNYLAALRALSVNATPNPLVRTLEFAQRYGQVIPWNSFDQARYVLDQTNAFMKSNLADELGKRVRMPSPELMADAEGRYPASSRP
jgi:fido (protein-threonine AMPylation protein)